MSESTFSWLAFSEGEQQRARDLAGLLSERETRDELGIGSIRDGVILSLAREQTAFDACARLLLCVWPDGPSRSILTDRRDQ